MRKVNEKLSQISTLATERHIAENAAKQRAEGSPTSTDSSTSTLKGDESAENIPALVKERETFTEVSTAKPANQDTGIKRAEKERECAAKILEATDGSKKRDGLLSNSTKTRELGSKLQESRPYTSRTGSRTSSMETKEYGTKLGEKEIRIGSRTTSMEKKEFGLRLSDRESTTTKVSSRTSSMETKEFGSRLSERSTYSTRFGLRTSSMETKEFGSQLSERETSTIRVGTRTTSLEKREFGTKLRESRELGTTTSKTTVERKEYGTRLGSSLETKELEMDKNSYRSATLDRASLRSNHRRNLSSEGTSRFTDYKTTTLDRPSSRNGSSSYDSLKTSDYTSRSATLDRTALRNGTHTYDRLKSSDYATSRSSTMDRQSLKSARSYDYSPRSSYKDRTKTDTLNIDSSSSGRKSPCTNHADVATLDPKTVESLEKYQRIKGKHRPTTPEPMSLPVTETKQLHSPERRHRRKSEGMTPIERKTGAHLVKTEPLQEQEELKKEETKKEIENELVKQDFEKEGTKKEAKEVDVHQTRTVTPTNGVEYKPKRGWSRKTYGGDNNTSRRFEMGISYFKKTDEPTKQDSPKPASPVKRVSSDSTSPVKPTSSETAFKRVSSSSKADSNPTSISTFTRNTPADRIWSERSEDTSYSRYSSRRSNNEELSKAFTSTSVRRISTETRNSEDSSTSRFTKSADYTPRKQNSCPTSPGTDRNEDSRSSSSSPRSKTPTERQRRIIEEGVPKVDIDQIPVVRSPSPKKIDSAASSSPTIKTPPLTSPSPPVARSVTPDESNKVPKISIEDTNPVIVVRSPSESRPTRNSGSSKTDQEVPNLSNSDQEVPNSSKNEVRLRQKSVISDHKRQIILNRRKTPVISPDALDQIMQGLIPEEELEGLAISASSRNSVALETCPEEDESPKFFPPSTRANKILKTAKSPPRSPEKKVTISTEVSSTDRKKYKLSERTKSLSSISPVRSPSPNARDTSPSSADPFSKSVDDRDFKGPVNRLRVSSMSLSRSTPDLTEILNSGKKSSKAKRVERSNSRRKMAMGHHRLDSYVTYTSPHMVYDSSFHSSGSVSSPRSSSRTLPSRVLGGQTISKVFSAFSRKEKENDKERSGRRKRLW